MTFDQIRKDLANKIYHPVYFLMGEEPYYIDQISGYMEDHVLESHEKEFNQTVLYGRETSVTSIIGEARRFPMASNYQVVLVKEAQDIQDIEKLEAYVETPQKSTILVICYKYKTIDKRKKLAKALAKKGVLLESKRLRDYMVPDWIARTASEQKLSMPPKSAMLLAEYLGADLSKIGNALRKLTLNVAAGEEITPALIEKYIGINKDYNNFELQNAVGAKDVLRANRIAGYYAKNPREHPLLLTLATLYALFSKVLIYHAAKGKSRNDLAAVLKVNPYFVRDYEVSAANYSPRQARNAISLLQEYDMRSKGDGGAAGEGELLRELIWKIVH